MDLVCPSLFQPTCNDQISPKLFTRTNPLPSSSTLSLTFRIDAKVSCAFLLLKKALWRSQLLVPYIRFTDRLRSLECPWLHRRRELINAGRGPTTTVHFLNCLKNSQEPPITATLQTAQGLDERCNKATPTTDRNDASASSFSNKVCQGVSATACLLLSFEVPRKEESLCRAHF